MLDDLLPISLTLDAPLLAGSGLWSLALYLGLPSVGDWLMDGLVRWFDFAERSLYFSQEASQKAFEKTRAARASQNAFYASILSILPFLLAGGIANGAIAQIFDKNWTIAWAVMAVFAAGVYELGRRSGPDRPDR
ncbi:MAG: hypothetical protein EA001_03525 [Oscillatoriales cyanobacterium]|nr:MAG: hypothetical protein EA001_03525 [Oscillatoriales cyanobacterium]